MQLRFWRRKPKLTPHERELAKGVGFWHGLHGWPRQLPTSLTLAQRRDFNRSYDKAAKSNMAKTLQKARQS